LKSIINVLRDGAVRDRFDEVTGIAKQRNPKEWQEYQNIIQKALDTLRNVEPDLSLSLSSSIAGELASIEEAAYFIGMADGLQMSKLTDESINKAELIFS